MPTGSRRAVRWPRPCTPDASRDHTTVGGRGQSASTRDDGAVHVHVVAAAIARDGRVLAARRSRPAAVAGGWEFPGGKVEAGESEPAALARECGEELGVALRLGRRLGAAVDGRIRLVLYAATLAAGEPRPLTDHDELRWLGADDLDEVGWLAVDRALLPHVVELLRKGVRMRFRATLE